MTTEEKIKGLEHLLRKCPDVITPKGVETVLGYEHEAVRRWINRGWLRITKAHNAELVPREWLIDFTCDYAYTITNMSDKHLKLMQKFFKQNQ